MSELTIFSNAYGQNLLRLVSRGNATIAELMRLKDYIPPAYRSDSKNVPQKYSTIITDFAYFKAVNVHERKIEGDPLLQQLDEELRINFSDILTRFYLVFESVHKYVTDLNNYIDELEDGVYIQQSLESVMLNEEGKQLLCEAIYLYGIMLLVIDFHFDGRVRERILVSYYRYNPQRTSTTKIDDVCMLLRSTGFVKNSFKRPQNYPENYFQRIPLNQSLVDFVIARLRTDEIYNQTNAFPHPNHRSMALSNQASMLVIALSFKPSMLNNQSAVMREIVDKFFPDSWVISIYMGIVIDLIDWWSPYKAAKTALNNTLESANIKNVAQKYGDRIEKHLKKVEEPHLALHLDEGAIGTVVKLIRECNVTLHWVLLHTADPTILTEDSKRSRSVKQTVIQETKFSIGNLLKLLLATAKIENDIKQMYKQILFDKESKWLKNREKCMRRVKNLADVFNGDKQLAEIEKNPQLGSWFMEISKHIESLGENDGRKIVQLVQALEEVQDFHQLEINLQVSQYLTETREILHNMLCTTTMNEDTMIALNIITDFCYAWNIIDTFIPMMQSLIKDNPDTVIQLKTLLLKMASGLEMPLLRINQARSADLSSVSQYYSRELEGFARRVLQIIPESVFGILAEIVHLETNVFHEIPTKLPKDKICDYAQLKERLEMAKLTYTISVYTKGMLSLRSVSLGILRVDSQRLLEDGIRQELVKKVTLALHSTLVFDNKSKDSLSSKLQYLSTVMDGYRKAFQYIQDYININSLKVWHEEVMYIISNAVEQECKGLSWTPEKSWSSFLEDKMNIQLIPTDANSLTFMGRLLRELIRLTNPKTTLYVEHTLAWYDLKTQAEVVTNKIFTLILQSIGTPGLAGLDKMVSHFVAVEMQNFIKSFEKTCRNKSWTEHLKEFTSILENIEYFKSNRARLSTSVASVLNKIWPSLLDSILKIGHYQLLRHKIAYELNSACKFEAKHMEAALRTLNEALLLEVSNKKLPAEKTDFLNELNTRMEWAGIIDVDNKVYVKTSTSNNVAFFTSLLTIPVLNKLYFCKNTACLLSKRVQDPLDAVVFILGVKSVLVQFNGSHLDEYVAYVCDYILSCVTIDGCKLNSEVETDAMTGVHYLNILQKYAKIEDSVIKEKIPAIVLDQYQAKLIK